MQKHSSRAAVMAVAFAFSGLVGAELAEAHVSISSGPAVANKSQKITFSVGHGCEGFDTVRVTVDIPAGISSVRPLRSDFGKPSLTTNDAGEVTAVTWEKPESERLAGDFAYYELTLRARVGEVAFTTILFTVRQTCIDANGDEVTVVWDEPPGGEGNTASSLVVVPARQSGWNRYVLAPKTTILEAAIPAYFGDAQIVWRGTAAYSSNANTLALIGITPGVTTLTGDLQAGDELWVRY
jgi:periplasmic copper chaperone A